jgi:hypothetical protein
VDPVDGEVAALLLGAADELAAELGPGCLGRLPQKETDSCGSNSVLFIKSLCDNVVSVFIVPSGRIFFSTLRIFVRPIPRTTDYFLPFWLVINCRHTHFTSRPAATFVRFADIKINLRLLYLTLRASHRILFGSA